jgi:NAD-dependent SIR2 family protein deacetylase
VVPAARRAGARVIILNAQPTACDDLAHAVMQGTIGDLLPAMCGQAPLN